MTLQEHLDWMRACHEAGTIVISGPSSDRSMSLYLIRAGTRAEAEQVAAADPFTAGGECRFELIEWEIHQMMGIGDFTAPR